MFAQLFTTKLSNEEATFYLVPMALILLGHLKKVFSEIAGTSFISIITNKGLLTRWKKKAELYAKFPLELVTPELSILLSFRQTNRFSKNLGLS